MKQNPCFFVKDNHIVDASGALLTLKSHFVEPDSEQLARFSCPEVYAALIAAGINVVRFGIYWDSVEHEAPDVYDEAFLALLRDCAKAAEAAGLIAVIEPRMSAWSAITGGIGAPRWTCEMAGFNDSLLNESASDVKNAASTLMYGLLLNGNDVAPRLYIDGCPVQDFLQDHYIAAMRHTARRLKDALNIAGFVLPEVPDVNSDSVKTSCRDVLQPGTVLADFDIQCFDSQKVTNGIAPFWYRFISAYTKKHPHFVMFAPAGNSFNALMAYEPSLPVCSQPLLP